MSYKEIDRVFKTYYLKLVHGNLLESNCEVIINSSNCALDFSQGFSKFLKKAGGEIIENELKKSYQDSNLKPRFSDVTPTSAGKLNFKYIFHCISPNKSQDEFELKFKKCIVNSLKLAQEKGVKSISFPAISCGAGGCPSNLSCDLMLKTFDEFMNSEDNLGVVECIEICLLEEKIFEEFSSKAMKIKIDPKKIVNKPIKKKIEQENVEEIKEEIQKKSNPLNSCKMHSQEKIYSYCIRDQCFYCKNCIDEHQSHKIIQISPFLQQIFRFNSFLGEGSFGSVFGIQNISNNNEYAIKIIGDVETPAHLDNQLREIKVLQKSNHKNIIKHYESFWIHTEQKLVILMDLAECNLTRVKKEEIWENLDYLIQLIEGLEYLHQNKIIHLDFKRQNILKCKNNQLKLSDFGECRIMKQNETKIQTLNEIGTESYMAPEFRSQNSEIKIKTSADIFSLGIVIHELLTEKHPFRDMKDGKVYINEENLNIDKSLNGTHFDSLIKACLKWEPKERPSATEIKEYLINIIRKINEKKEILKEK